MRRHVMCVHLHMSRQEGGRRDRTEVHAKPARVAVGRNWVPDCWRHWVLEVGVMGRVEWEGAYGGWRREGDRAGVGRVTSAR